MLKRTDSFLLLLMAGLSLGGCSMGVPELLIILGIVVVLFGATRLPALGKALGETVKSFKDSTENGALDGEKEKARLADKGTEKIQDASIEEVKEKKDA